MSAAMAARYDLIAVGGGPGGDAAAIRPAPHGTKGAPGHGLFGAACRDEGIHLGPNFREVDRGLRCSFGRSGSGDHLAHHDPQRERDEGGSDQHERILLAASKRCQFPIDLIADGLDSAFIGGFAQFLVELANGPPACCFAKAPRQRLQALSNI